ncbi:hypothetical protein HPB49_009291 [Dermacentor silvarum]|uniref:Uncharacterized protein n=1 Tax=Dermacentor silvarum TaxID=543639 RepID=A0ACB8DYC7_DERSI|nr:hypothetical protein HPB49_009291 [Dermacentor silvarum]
MIPFLGSDMVLHFHSNVATTRRGFSVRARQIKCALGTSPAPPPPSQLPGPPGSSHPDYGALDGKSQGVVVTTTTPVGIRTPYGPGSVSSATGEPYITRRSCVVCMDKHVCHSSATASRGIPGPERRSWKKMQEQHANVVVLPPPPLCDMCTDRLSDDITSYGFPTAYRGKMLCRVTISRPSDAFCAFEMHFREFDVEKSSRCDRDFL